MAAGYLRAALSDRRRSARAALVVLGSTSAVSWPVLAMYAPLAIAIQVPGNVATFGGPPARWALASAIGMVALGAVLSALRIASRDRQLRPVAVLGVFAVGATAQSVMFGLATIVLGAADDLHLPLRLMGLLWQLPLLTAIGYAVCRHDAHRRVITDLERTRRQLLAIGQSLDAEVSRLEAELAGAVRASLDPALAALDQALALAQAECGSDRASAIGVLDAIIEERIRPLSHELAAGNVRPDDLADEAPTARARVPVPARFRLGAGIGAGFAAVAIAIGALPTALREFTPAHVIVYDAAFAGGVWAALTLCRRALRDIELRTPIGVPIVVAINVAVGSAVLWAIGAVGIARPTGLAASVAALFALIGTATVLTLLVQARRSASEAELAAVAKRLDHAHETLRRRERLVARRLAFLIHGSLQGALHAAAMRITRAEAVDDALVAHIRHDVEVALAQIDGGPAVATNRTTMMIGEIEAVWGDIREVTTRLTPGVESALRADPDVDEAVAEVIREAVNNALRHGAADRVEVAVDLVDGSAIAITVRDDGTAAVATKPGLGSALFDDLCRSWSTAGDASGSTFHAVIPLDARLVTA